MFLRPHHRHKPRRPTHDHKEIIMFTYHFTAFLDTYFIVAAIVFVLAAAGFAAIVSTGRQATSRTVGTKSQEFVRAV
jgi:hypothetical protein